MIGLLGLNLAQKKKDLSTPRYLRKGSTLLNYSHPTHTVNNVLFPKAWSLNT